MTFLQKFWEKLASRAMDAGFAGSGALLAKGIIGGHAALDATMIVAVSAAFFALMLGVSYYAYCKADAIAAGEVAAEDLGDDQ